MCPKKIYCERGAYRKELRELELSGKIEIVSFPYEGRNRKTPKDSRPSIITMDSTYITWDMTFLIGDAVESDKFSQIASMVGKNNTMDIRQIDAAYKSQCQVFLSPDKGDIISNRNELEGLLGMKFFHPKENWDEFLAFINS